MHIFDTPDQALRFAFILDAFPGDLASPNLMVRAALHEAGIERRQINLNLVPPADVRAEAERIIQLVREGELLQYERAALIVAFSRNWDERREAVATLAPYFCPGLRHVIDDPKVVSKLVARQYIAERDRDGSWRLSAIADQFTVAIQKVQVSAQYIAKMASQLHNVALDSARLLIEKEVPHVV